MHPALAALLIMSIMTPVQADETIWAALKQGGKVVLMRHAVVDRNKGHGTRHVPGDCSQEFNLSQVGRAQVKKVSELFRTRGIPVGDVLTSPYCRTMDTAKLAFGKSKPSDALKLIETLPPAQAEQVTAQATKLIGEYKGKGNLALVTHEPNIVALAFETVESGGMFVLAPKGADQFDVLGKLPAPRD